MTILRLANALADTLAMDLKHKGSKFYGSREVWLMGLIEGAHLVVRPKVVHSLLDMPQEVMGLVVHVVGRLYLVTFVDGKKGDVTLFVVNGEKLDWKTSEEFTNPFGPHWTRKELYAKIVDGIEAVYSRLIYQNNWQSFKNGRKMIEEYLQLRKDGLSSALAMDKVFDKYAEAPDMDASREVQQS